MVGDQQCWRFSEEDPSDLSDPDSLVRKTFQAIWHELPRVLLGNAMFCLLCAPAISLAFANLLLPAICLAVITVFPAWAALLAFEDKILQGSATTVRDLLRAFTRVWGRSTTLGLLALVPALGAFVALPGLGAQRVHWTVWLALVANALSLLILVALYVYAFPLVAMHDLSTGMALRNALILASRHLWSTFGMMSLAILLVLGVLYVSSGIAFFAPAFFGMFSVSNCKMVVQEELSRDSANSDV
jgi:uncharacterized membrane protein YesL